MTEQEKKECGAYCRKFWPDQVSHILRIAEDAVNQCFLFDLPWDMEQTAEPVTFEGEIDWQHMPSGDPEFIYQFNRHRYWICLGQAWAMTGDEKYAECFREQLLSWLKKNPITEETRRTTWRTIEAGIRGENWVKAAEYFWDSRSMDSRTQKAFLEGLEEHGRYLTEQEVPFSDKSNWGVLESHGLFDVGAFLIKKGDQEQAALGASFVKEALVRLERELDIQVMDDGVHWEQSPMYHNEVLRCVLEVLRMAEQTGIRIPESIRKRALQMALADLYWMKPDGTQPMSGDSDRTSLRDVLTPAAWLLKDERLRFCGCDRMDFESVWDFGMKAAAEYEAMEKQAPEPGAAALECSGNYMLRSDWGEGANYLHFKCGSLGGGHGHFDKLHLDLVLNGEDVLVDSGRYTYVDGALRRRLKGAAAHNVPMIDGREYTRCIGSWDVADAAAPIGWQRGEKGEFSFVQGSHLGYLSSGMQVIRKVIAVGTNAYVLVDSFYGMGEHTVSQRFHFNPEGETTLTGQGVFYKGKRTAAELMVLTSGARLDLTKEPLSFSYNTLEQGACAVVSLTSALPAFLVTVIVPGEKGWSAQMVPVEVPVTGRVLPETAGTAVRIRQADQSWLVVINHGETSADGEYIGACGHYGLGRVMACEEREPGMQVLQW